MSYPTYLVHFNQNHDKRNGQFTYGDGDGDGISNDHAHRSKGIRKAVSYRIKNGVYESPGKTVGQQRVSTTRKKMGIFAGAVAISALVAGGILVANKVSKMRSNSPEFFDYEKKGSIFIDDSKWDSLKLNDGGITWRNYDGSVDDSYTTSTYSNRRWTQWLPTSNFVKDGYWHQ